MSHCFVGLSYCTGKKALSFYRKYTFFFEDVSVLSAKKVRSLRIVVSEILGVSKSDQFISLVILGESIKWSSLSLS